MSVIRCDAVCLQCHANTSYQLLNIAVNNKLTNLELSYNTDNNTDNATHYDNCEHETEARDQTCLWSIILLHEEH